MAEDIGQRKADHLDLCATDAVAFRGKTTLLEEVQLVHQALPDCSLDDVDTSVELLGKRLRAPIVIAAMTGGHERAGEINRELAAIAEARGYGFGLGSQRAMKLRPETAWTFQVREVAPTALLLGNIGVVQAREASDADVLGLVEKVGADALCVHMNPAMELVQPGGDRDFRGGTATFRRLVEALPVPVIAKETGSGISREVAARLVEAGVRHVDTSGAGGTSWVGVETLRAEGGARSLGEALWDWGVPTAASASYCVEAGLITIATGGLASGMDVARALALGAHAGGLARQVFMAFVKGGREATEEYLEAIERELRSVMLLCGATDVASMRRVPKILGAGLERWLSVPRP